MREPLYAEEVERLCQACESLEEKLIVWTLVDTGMRVSELCNLKTEQILWQRKAICIDNTKSDGDVVPMSKRVQTLLEHYFSTSNHWFVRPQQAQKIVKHVANKAKLSKKVTPHSLRYNPVTLAAQKKFFSVMLEEILQNLPGYVTIPDLNPID